MEEIIALKVPKMVEEVVLETADTAKESQNEERVEEITLGMDFFITGQGTPMIFIWKVSIPGLKLWCPKTANSWKIISNITIYSKNSDQYLSFEMLNILLQLVKVGL